MKWLSGPTLLPLQSRSLRPEERLALIVMSSAVSSPSGKGVAYHRMTLEELADACGITVAAADRMWKVFGDKGWMKPFVILDGGPAHNDTAWVMLEVSSYEL